jgi:hypothetical protein
MTTIRDGACLEQHDGQKVRLVGTYSVTSTGPHRLVFTRPDGTTGSTDQLVQLGLDGDVWVMLGARPDEEIAQLEGKTAVAVGKLIARPARSGRGAQPDPQPTLVQITSISAHRDH